MHSAIIVVEETSARADWSRFLDEIRKKLVDAKGVDRLGENVWLVDFQKSPVALAWIVGFADRFGLVYKILPLADAPQWLPVASDPKPK